MNTFRQRLFLGRVDISSPIPHASVSKYIIKGILHFAAKETFTMPRTLLTAWMPYIFAAAPTQCPSYPFWCHCCNNLMGYRVSTVLFVILKLHSRLTLVADDCVEYQYSMKSARLCKCETVFEHKVLQLSGRKYVSFLPHCTPNLPFPLSKWNLWRIVIMVRHLSPSSFLGRGSSCCKERFSVGYLV